MHMFAGAGQPHMSHYLGVPIHLSRARFRHDRPCQILQLRRLRYPQNTLNTTITVVADLVPTPLVATIANDHYDHN